MQLVCRRTLPCNDNNIKVWVSREAEAEEHYIFALKTWEEIPHPALPMLAGEAKVDLLYDLYRQVNLSKTSW